MKVENMKNSRGKDVPNQFLIHTDGGTMFRSYASAIALKRKDGKIILGRNWAYSKTTGKYRNLFLGETKRETQAKVNSGEYIVDNDL